MVKKNNKVFKARKRCLVVLKKRGKQRGGNGSSSAEFEKFAEWIKTKDIDSVYTIPSPISRDEFAKEYINAELSNHTIRDKNNRKYETYYIDTRDIKNKISKNYETNLASWATGFFENVIKEKANEIVNSYSDNIDSHIDEIKDKYKEYSLIIDDIIIEAKKQAASAAAAQNQAPFPMNHPRPAQNQGPFPMNHPRPAQTKAEKEATWKKYKKENPNPQSWGFGEPDSSQKTNPSQPKEKTNDEKRAEAFNTLGVDPKLSDKEIKKAVRNLLKIWHPDKWSTKTDMEQKTAEDKFKEIVSARDFLKKLGHQLGGTYTLKELFKMFGGKKKSKKTRKHRGIIQTGGNKGRLRKGYKYSGKRLKNGMPEILKVKSKK